MGILTAAPKTAPSILPVSYAHFLTTNLSRSSLQCQWHVFLQYTQALISLFLKWVGKNTTAYQTTFTKRWRWQLVGLQGG